MIAYQQTCLPLRVANSQDAARFEASLCLADLWAVVAENPASLTQTVVESRARSVGTSTGIEIPLEAKPEKMKPLLNTEALTKRG